MNRLQRAIARMARLPVAKGAVAPVDLSALDSRVNGGGGWITLFGGIREAFAGAWQRNIVMDAPQDLLGFSPVYGCISLISDDISKLDLCLKQQDPTSGVWVDASPNSPFWRVLRKPNGFQTLQQFLAQWLVAKLMFGNAYVLKGRESIRGMVNALYVLDSRLVMPLVTDDGDIYYQLKRDPLSGVTANSIVVPASEIIHDRCMAVWHPLCGVTPIYACAVSATQGRRIQGNATRFFENMSRPSGVLTAPGKITDDVAKRLKADFESNFAGNNIGRLLVAGDGLTYEAMTIPATEAQLVEQLKWTVEDICRAYKVPPYKLQAGPALALNNIGALALDYFNTTLQPHVEGIEALLEDGLELAKAAGVSLAIEFDTDGLLRMDPLGQAEADQKLIQSAILAPNEGRAKRNLKPVDGGDTPYLQIQNSSLAALSRRDSAAAAAPPAGDVPPALPSPPNATPAEPVQPAKQLPRLTDIKAHAKVTLHGREFRIAA